MNTLYKRPSADKASAENPPAAYSADKASKNPPAAYSADKASAKNPPAAYDDSALSFRNVDVEVSETSGKVTVRANKEPTFRERIADKLDKLYGKFPNLRDFSFKSLLTSIKTHATAIFRLFGSPGKEASAVNMWRGNFARPGDKTNFAPSVPEKNETYIFNFASFELSLKKELNADSAENIVKDIKSKEGREYIKSKKFLESDKSEQLTKKLIDYAVDTEGAAFFQGQKLPVTESIGTLIRLDPTYFNNVVKYLNDKPNLERYDRENPSYIQMKKELKNYLVNLGLSDKGKEIFEKLDQGQLKKLFTAEELKALFPSK